jgi:hypothetical protein
MIAESPLQWKTRHIEGHQDDNPQASLDFWAVQNIKVDNLTRICWMEHSSTAPVQYPISGKGFQVWLGNRKLSSSYSSVFFDHINGKTILEWHSSHARFPACYARHINWEACGAALKRLPLGRQRRVSKHTSGFYGVGTKMVYWKQQPTPECPRCGEPEKRPTRSALPRTGCLFCLGTPYVLVQGLARVCPHG